MSCSSIAARIVFNSSIEDLESRYREVTVHPGQLAAATGAQADERSARSLVAASCSSIHVDRQQLAALGEVRTVGLADLFVAA